MTNRGSGWWGDGGWGKVRPCGPSFLRAMIRPEGPLLSLPPTPYPPPLAFPSPLAPELLRFTTAGSVDDGKSTLIGRLLYDSKGVYEDQVASVRKATRNQTTGGLDLSLLTDGLRAEREQGITIDVAYRYFATARRKFIIADTPGHEQYTRNMATGASTANLAIVLIDARYGVLPQSRRHAYIASLLGIPHMVVAVNKMDLVDFRQEVFDAIRRDFQAFADQLEIRRRAVHPHQRAGGRQRGAAQQPHALVRRSQPAGAPGNRSHRERPQPDGLPLSRCNT